MKQEDKMSKTKLVPFDIEKAKNGAKIVTRSGLSAKRVDVDVNNGHPVLCLVTWKDGIETPILYSIDGRYYPDQTDDRDLFIEEEVEETEDYNPYKTAVEVIANMVERYSELQSIEELKDFYNNVKVKCREAVEYDKKWCKKQDEQKKIEKAKTRRMTNQELSWWLREHPEEHREWKFETCSDVYTSRGYSEEKEHNPVAGNILIRRNCGEWEKPLIEI